MNVITIILLTLFN